MCIFVWSRALFTWRARPASGLWGMEPALGMAVGWFYCCLAALVHRNLLGDLFSPGALTCRSRMIIVTTCPIPRFKDGTTELMNLSSPIYCILTTHVRSPAPPSTGLEHGEQKDLISVLVIAKSDPLRWIHLQLETPRGLDTKCEKYEQGGGKEYHRVGLLERVIPSPAPDILHSL